MKSHQIKRDVDVSQELETSTFRIQNNAKMFSILADKLYSDKPRAVVREISCNALDAHGMNGQTRPFIIVVPNAIEPMLTIRDFGPGMSHETVMEVFTDFGASTKDQDDAAIGGFGLGCKSPFAYADAFTVTVWQDGMERNYAAYHGPDGIPRMSLAGEPVASDEPDGVCVRVPVKVEDWSEFRNTAEDILQYFPEGSFEPVGFEVEVQQYSKVTDTYRIRDGGSTEALALMGPVAYPLDWDLVLKEDDQRLPRSILPVFKIGELDLQPSREGLSYDSVTKERIRARYLEIVETIAEDMYAEVKDLPIVQQLQAIQKFERAGTWKFVETRWTTEEPKLNDKGEPVLDSKGEPVMVKKFTGFPGVPMQLELPGPIHWVDVDYARSWSSAANPKINVLTRAPIMPKLTASQLEKAVFVFDDLTDLSEGKRRVSTRLRRHLKSLGLKELHYYMYGHDRLTNPSTQAQRQSGQAPKPVYDYLTEVSTFEQLKALFPGWDLIEERVVRLSDLDLPETVHTPREPGVPRVKTELARVLYINGNSNGYYTPWNRNTPWNELTEVTVNEGVYVPLINYDLEEDSLHRPLFPYMFVRGKRILGLSKKARKQIRDDGNEADFVRLEDFIAAEAKRVRNDPDVKVELGRREFLSELKDNLEFQRAYEVMRRCPELFPHIRDEMGRVSNPVRAGIDQDIAALADHIFRTDGPPLPKAKAFRSNIVKMVEREVARSPLLRCAIHSGTDWLSRLSGREDDIAALVKLSRK